MASPPPPGIYVPVPTFFARKTASTYNAIAPPPDIETQAQHSVYLAKNGVRGLVVLGSTGEAIHLTNAERSDVLKGVRKAFDDAGFPEYPIVAGTATQNIDETVMQLVEAQEAGAGWGLVLTPGYFAGCSNQEGIVRWFTAVADRSPIPIMIYHYPGVSNNVKVDASTYVTLSKHPNIVGCKLSHGDVSLLAQVASSPEVDHSHFHVFTGLGQQLLPVVVVGGVGAIDGCAGFFPKTVVKLFELSMKNPVSDEDVKRRRLLQYKVSSMEEFVAKFGTVGIKEAISRICGFGDADGCRLPLHGGIPGGDAEWAKWKGIVEMMEEEEKSL